MTRGEINRLPLTRYSGPVHLVSTTSDAARAVEALHHERVLGFDTETRPSFSRYVSYPTALIQLAGTEAVYLFQLAQLGRLGPLADLFAAPEIIKAGVALSDDVKALRAIDDFIPAGFVELSTMSSCCGIANNGLRGLVAACLGLRISKSSQRSNWGRKQLSPEQISYAATDAWASREVYLALERL